MSTRRFSPFPLLLVALIVVPLVEIYLLISVGRVIGALPTVLLVVLTAVIGAWLLRLQGLQTMARVQSALGEGTLPTRELVAGVILLASACFLLTPGFFTDALGFAALVPQWRRAAAQMLITRWSRAHNIQPSARTTAYTIEGTFTREDS